MITRRNLFPLALGAAVTAAPYLSAENSLSPRLNNFSSLWLKRNICLPPTLEDKIFWGYRTKPVPDYPNLLDGIAKYARPTIDLMRVTHPLAINETVTFEQPINNDIYSRFIRKSLTPEQRQIAAELKALIARENKQLDKLSYTDRVDRIADFLINDRVLASIDYDATDSGYGHAQGPAELITSGKGCCRDFALSRLVIATALGLKHAQCGLIMYYINDPTNPSRYHANFGFYQPSKNRWMILENTGRYLPQEIGAIGLYPSDKLVIDDLKNIDSLGCVLVPILGINRIGVWGFDSFEENQSEEYILKPRQASVVAAAKGDITFNPGYARGESGQNGGQPVHHTARDRLAMLLAHADTNPVATPSI